MPDDATFTTTLAPQPRRTGSDFAALNRQISAAGLLRRRPFYYAGRIGAVVAAHVAVWAAFFTLGDTWWQAALAVVLAVVFAQTALVAHDIAHRQVFRSRRVSQIVGRIVGNLGLGMAYGWWNDKHTRHHANPNHEELDPDVAPDLLVWSERQAEQAAGLTRAVSQWQAFLFFPLLMLEGFNLHVASVRATLRPETKRRWLELALLLTHFTFFLGALFATLPLGKAVVFLVINQAVFGVYLGCAFAPNHKGMPTLTADDHLDYLRKQVLTSRNVRGGRVVDVLLGGLNYQIEHHLFPSMPTPNLRQARPIVQAHCAEIGVPYHETGLVESYRIALRHLHEVGRPLREGRGRQPVS